MLQHKLFPMMRFADRDVDDWKPCFYATGYGIDNTGAWDIDDAYEYYTYIQERDRITDVFVSTLNRKQTSLSRVCFVFC